MNDNERDTHFQNFAKLLLREIDLAGSMSPSDYSPYRFEKARQNVIARRAYDLAEHIISLVPQLVQAYPDLHTAQEVVVRIPDVEKLPER